ncbi:MAG TPA: thioredoxin domain-containing protein [Candidatus Saccharimonadales bacterium]|jgi:protein-disulfide isomerase
MDRTRWIIFSVICVAVLGSLVLFSRRDEVDVSKVEPAKAISETETAIGDHIYGDKSSPVVLIEYGDFQCPACGSAFPQIQTIKKTYGDKIAFIFRNYPLTTIHPNALAASTTAEAAGLQGKFWEMHDQLYANQQAWSDVDASKRTDSFVGFAKDIGLDTAKFREDLKDPKVNAKITRDRSLGDKLKVQSTPSVYLGDTSLSQDEITDLVQQKGTKLMDKLDAALKAADIEPPQRPADS